MVESTNQQPSKEKDPSATLSLLARAHSPGLATRILRDKIYHRPVLLRPSSPPPFNARECRRRVRLRKTQDRKKGLKPKPLTARERRRLGLYDVQHGAQKYETFEPLHRLWVGYIKELLGEDIYGRGDSGVCGYWAGQGAAVKLASADFHGAEVEVVRSGCVSRVGVKGIVVKDTKFTLEVVTRKNRVKLIPKEGTIFRVEVPAQVEQKGRYRTAEMADEAMLSTALIVFELHGGQMKFRSADRATKKFKEHFLKDL